MTKKMNFTDDQIREVQEKRGTSRKMAIQWLKRNGGKAAAPAKANKPGKATTPPAATEAPKPEAPKAAAPAKPNREKGASTEKRAEILASRLRPSQNYAKISAI